MGEVSVVIPTYRRPDGVRTAVTSILAGAADEAHEVVVVDNDPARSAEGMTAALAAGSAVRVRYIPEPRRGISHARNAGVAAASGRFIAFLDDDEEVEPGWLSAFLATLARSGADAAVGPVLPHFPEGAAITAYCREVYTRDARAPSGTPLLRWNIGNSIFLKDRCFRAAEPFDPRLGLTGGEDTLFLRQLTRGGGRLVWCAEAVAWESVPADRTEANYLVRRMFRGAQTTTYVCAAVRPRELGRAARLMAAGCVQLALWGPAAGVLRLGNHALWPKAAAKAAAGLGKVLWHPRLHPRLYQ